MSASLMALLRNAILLFALVFVYGIVNFRMLKRRLIGEIVTGLIVGAFAILVIMNPWEMESGLIFDARSVLLSVSSAFFGWIPAVIAGAIAAAYRIWLGGDGVYAGVLTVVVSVAMGLLWQRFRSHRKGIRYGYEFLAFGFLNHVLVIGCQLAIPWPKAFTVIGNIWLPFLVFYPILTAILALALQNQRVRNLQADQIRRDQILLRAVIESPKGMAAMAVDREYRFLVFNTDYRRIFEKLFGCTPRVGTSVVDLFPSDELRSAIKLDIDRALAGESYQSLRPAFAETLWFEALWSPIHDGGGEIIGATQFFQDVTERIKKDEEILYLSRHDPLTGLRNRRAYSEELKRPAETFDFPVTVVMADINGLKITNDAFGHAAGDQLLLKITETFMTRFREKDRIYRIGGDEFVVFLEGTEREAAEDIVDAIKAEFERTTLFGLSVSVSFGIDTNRDGTDLLESVKLAEIEMYDHKLVEISSNRGEAIKTILSTLRLKNPREDVHSHRVAEYCQMIGEGLRMRREQVAVLKMIGNLHDIGKIAIEESVLNKNGPLTAEEWGVVRRHPEIGYRILASSTEYADIAEDILAHHERWDGKGYPKGLRGEQIPLRARIIAVADTFEAMTADRPYRAAVTPEKALAEIKRCSGTQFDPDIAELFIAEYTRRNMKEPEPTDSEPME
ncbi:MAG: HD domain-containing phosphohydrolase [Candidatus Izemoplasmatales bacterium]